MAPRGRPPSDNPRRHVVTLRLSDEELELVRAAAATLEGVPVATWMRTIVLRAARRRVSGG